MLPLNFSGLFGIWLMTVITVFFAAVFLGASVFALVYRKYGARAGIRRGAVQFVFASLMILLVNILATYLLASNQSGEQQYFKGAELDDFALYVWLPINVIGSILVAFLVWSLNRSKRIKVAE